jgi:hypothetical protein
MSGKVMLTLRIPIGLKKVFSTMAAERGMSVTSAISHLMYREVVKYLGPAEYRRQIARRTGEDEKTY